MIHNDPEISNLSLQFSPVDCSRNRARSFVWPKPRQPFRHANAVSRLGKVASCRVPMTTVFGAKNFLHYYARRKNFKQLVHTLHRAPSPTDRGEGLTCEGGIALLAHALPPKSTFFLSLHKFYSQFSRIFSVVVLLR